MLMYLFYNGHEKLPGEIQHKEVEKVSNSEGSVRASGLIIRCDLYAFINLYPLEDQIQVQIIFVILNIYLDRKSDINRRQWRRINRLRGSVTAGESQGKMALLNTAEM